MGLLPQKLIFKFSEPEFVTAKVALRRCRKELRSATSKCVLMIMVCFFSLKSTTEFKVRLQNSDPGRIGRFALLPVETLACKLDDGPVLSSSSM